MNVSIGAGWPGGHPSLVRAALDLVDVPMLIVAADGEPVLMNMAWRQVHGVLAGPVTWTELVSTRQVLAPDGLKVLAEEELPSRRALQGVAHRCEVVLDVDGVRRRWLVNAQPIFGDDGEVVGAVVTGLDASLARPKDPLLIEDAGRLTAVAEACREVLRDSDARVALCRSARSLCQAVGASLWEPDQLGELRATAADGPVPPGMRLPAGRGSNTARAFSTIRTHTADHVGRGSGVNADIIETVSVLASRRVGAGIWVPVVAHGRCLAVLVVGLPGSSGPRDGATAGPLQAYVPVLEVLAAEAAIAIERQDLLRRLQVEVGTDPLTGMANRRTWQQELPRYLREAAAAGVTVSLSVLDLDHFKDYNDRHGHPAGDALLCEMAVLWQRRLRPGDLLCRIGGEEFALVLPGCDSTAALRVIQDLRSRVPRRQTVSAGLAQWDLVESPDGLFDRADAALYAAKAAGRDRISVAAQPSYPAVRD